jgi:hypothetical protein
MRDWRVYYFRFGEMRLGNNENNMIVDNGDISGGARGLNG